MHRPIFILLTSQNIAIILFSFVVLLTLHRQVHLPPRHVLKQGALSSGYSERRRVGAQRRLRPSYLATLSFNAPHFSFYTFLAIRPDFTIIVISLPACPTSPTAFNLCTPHGISATACKDCFCARILRPQDIPIKQTTALKPLES